MKATGLILSAGLSTRMGEFKPAMNIDGKALLHRVIENISPFVDEIIVVAGYKSEVIVDLCAPYPKTQVVINMDYTQGMFSSILTGIANFANDLLFILPGDYPFIGAETYQKLLEAADNSTSTIFIPLHSNRKGHPVLFRKEAVEKLQASPRDSNLRLFIRKSIFETVATNDPGIHQDIDKPKDLEKRI